MFNRYSTLQPTKPLLVPKYTWTIFALSVGAMVVFLSVIPLQLPPLVGVGFNVDKLAHSFAYFVLTTCVGMALWIDCKKEGIYSTVFLTVFSFGMILELIQGYALSYRAFEAYDLLANSLGIITFLATGKTLKKIVVKSGIFIN